MNIKGFHYQIYGQIFILLQEHPKTQDYIQHRNPRNYWKELYNYIQMKIVIYWTLFVGQVQQVLLQIN